ncbi:MAG: hypothetical protein ACREJ2_00670 [Planctomycetota bacterium]
MAHFLFVVNRVDGLRATFSTAYLAAALVRRGAAVDVTDLQHLDWDSSRATVARAVRLPVFARTPAAVCGVLQAAAGAERRRRAAMRSQAAPPPTSLAVAAPAAVAPFPACPSAMTSDALHAVAPAADAPAGALESPVWRPVPAQVLEAVWLRCNPHVRRQAGNPVFAWAAGVEALGALCLNRPAGLCRTLEKSHLFDLPAELRPHSLISCSRTDILACVRFLGRTVVLKPARGYGGEQVFIVERGRFDNLNAILEVLLERGPVLVQEYLQAAADGDRRVLLWDARPIETNGRASLYRRMRPPGDLRNNLHVGGTRARCRLNRNDLAVIDGVGPYLRQQGLWLAGLDVIGGRVIEINACAPGGIHNINELYGLAIDDALAARACQALEAHRSMPALSAGALPARGAGTPVSPRAGTPVSPRADAMVPARADALVSARADALVSARADALVAPRAG